VNPCQNPPPNPANEEKSEKDVNCRLKKYKLERSEIPALFFFALRSKKAAGTRTEKTEK
jgi:hypothetical protein